jgi:sulfite reductase alpha subunit-like flavoprotein
MAAGSRGALEHAGRRRLQLLTSMNSKAAAKPMQPSAAGGADRVEIDLGDSGLEYTPGDALGVWPHNCPQVGGSLRLGCPRAVN